MLEWQVSLCGFYLAASEYISIVVFIEGWALYSDNPLLSKDLDLYKNNILQKYGMLKWQLRLCGFYLSVSECILTVIGN